MTISVEPAGTEAELATFLAIGAEVHSGPWPDVATLEHELATEHRHALPARIARRCCR